MKKLVIGVIVVFTIITSCKNEPTIIERINEKGIKLNIKSVNGKYLSSNWDEFIYADKDEASLWEEFTVYALNDGNYVFQAHTGKYLSADLGSDQEIESNREKYSTWELFKLVEINDSTIAIKANNNKYVTVNSDDLRLFATSDTINDREQFIFIIKN